MWLDSGYIENNNENYVYYSNTWEKNDLYQAYNKLKTFLDLKSLPELNIKQLTEFVDVYWNRI